MLPLPHEVTPVNPWAACIDAFTAGIDCAAVQAAGEPFGADADGLGRGAACRLATGRPGRAAAAA